MHRSPSFDVKAKEMPSCQRKKIQVFSEKDPGKIPYGDLGVDYVIESTGHFTHIEDAKKHILAGAKRVIISAPGRDGDMPTFVWA